MNVLLVFNCVPNDLRLYYYNNPDPKLLDLLLRSHNKYVNVSKVIDKDVEEFLSKLSNKTGLYEPLYVQNRKETLAPSIYEGTVVVCGVYV